MSVDDFRWLVGTAIGVVTTIAVIAIAAFRAMSSRLDTAVESVETAVKTGDKELHDRVSRLREEMSNAYVRRVDLDSHMARVDATLKELRDDSKEMIKQLAALNARRSREQD